MWDGAETLGSEPCEEHVACASAGILMAPWHGRREE